MRYINYKSERFIEVRKLAAYSLNQGTSRMAFKKLNCTSHNFLEHSYVKMEQGSYALGTVLLDTCLGWTYIALLSEPSGPKGVNKVVILNHKHTMMDIYSFVHYIKLTSVSFSVLPIHQSFESACNILCAIFSGSTLCFKDSIKHLVRKIALYKLILNKFWGNFVQIVRGGKSLRKEFINIYRLGLTYPKSWFYLSLLTNA